MAKAVAEPRRPTLVGIPGPANLAAPGGRGQASDDLDWEVPTRPVPPVAAPEPDPMPAAPAPAANVAAPPAAPDGSRTAKLPAAVVPATGPGEAAPPGNQTQKLPAAALPAAPAPPAPAQASPALEQGPEAAIHIEVEELPPESKPSGIGEKYVPKEEGAPPVVLDDEVRATELRAQAALEAQHRARRAPTIAKLKAIELPTTLVSAEPYVPPPKAGYGRLLGLGAIVALVAGGVVVFFGRGKPTAEPVEAPTATAAKVVPDTAAPPPPPPPVETASAAPAPDAPSPSAAASAESGSASPAPTGEPAPPAKHAVAPKSHATGPAVKPSPAPRPSPAPKPAPAAAKPASKPPAAAPKPTGGKAVIVRDSPF